MHAATITIQYVNLPSPPRTPGGKPGPGSIKDTNGVVYKVWGDQLNNFIGKEGETVTINYKIDEFMGKPQNTVLGLAGTTKGMPPARPSPVAVDQQAPRGGTVRPNTPQLDGSAQAQAMGYPPAPQSRLDPAKQAENIAVLALVKVYEKQLQVGDRQALVAALRMCRSAWRELQTGDVRPSFKEDFNDELPSFEGGAKSIEETF